MIPTDWLDQLVYYVPESEPYNVNMEMFGYETELLIANAGIVMWTIYINLGLLFIYVVFNWIPCLRRSLSKYLFWNNLVRLLAEVYLEVLMLSAMNLRKIDWSNPFSFVKYSNMISLFIILAILISPLVLIYHFYKKRPEWQEDSFKEKHGTMFEGLKTNSELVPKSVVLFMILSFFLRRIIFVAALFLFEDYVWP